MEKCAWNRYGPVRWITKAAGLFVLAMAMYAMLPVFSAAATALPQGLGGREWTAIQTSHKVVALTFDAGANADGVNSILSTLGRRHVRATFFLTGNFVRDFPGPARKIAAAGERIANHSTTHRYFTHLTDAQIRADVLGASTRITKITGADTWPWFRFPFGDRNQRTIAAVNSVGYVPVGWAVDTLGWEGTSGGITVATVVNRVLAHLQPGEIVLMHCGSHPTDHSTLDAAALPRVIDQLRSRGYSFVTLDAMRGIGYLVATSTGGVHEFGAPWYGSKANQLPAGVKPVGLAVDSASGGYWMLKSDGGVEDFNAPWHGSLRGALPKGQRVTAIAATPRGGYLVLTSNGGVHNFGASWYGSDANKLPVGVRAVGLAVDPATGGYSVLKSDGGVDSFNAPWKGSLKGHIPAGQAVVALGAPRSGGYLVLTSNGGVHNFGASWYGSDANKLPAGVRAVGLAADPATGGYWVLKSDGGVDSFNAPWYGSLKGSIAAGQSVTAIAGE